MKGGALAFVYEPDNRRFRVFHQPQQRARAGHTDLIHLLVPQLVDAHENTFFFKWGFFDEFHPSAGGAQVAFALISSFVSAASTRSKKSAAAPPFGFASCCFALGFLEGEEALVTLLCGPGLSISTLTPNADRLIDSASRAQGSSVTGLVPRRA